MCKVSTRLSCIQTTIKWWPVVVLVCEPDEFRLQFICAISFMTLFYSLAINNWRYDYLTHSIVTLSIVWIFEQRSCEWNKLNRHRHKKKHIFMTSTKSETSSNLSENNNRWLYLYGSNRRLCKWFDVPHLR